MYLGCEFVKELIIKMSVHKVYQYFDLTFNNFKCLLVMTEHRLSLQDQSDY